MEEVRYSLFKSFLVLVKYLAISYLNNIFTKILQSKYSDTEAKQKQDKIQI